MLEFVRNSKLLILFIEIQEGKLWFAPLASFFLFGNSQDVAFVQLNGSVQD